MNTKALQPYFLGALIAVLCVLGFFIFKPFLVMLILAAVFAVVLQSPYHAIFRHMPRSPGIAALITILFLVVCIFTPLFSIGAYVASDARELYSLLTDGGGKTYVAEVIQYAHGVASRYVPGLAGPDLSLAADEYIKNGLSWFMSNIGDAFSGVARFLLSLFIFLIALYYFLRDGRQFKRAIIDASPLADANDELIFARLELAVNSVIKGSLMIAFIQGVLTGIGFTIFGIPNSILWGVVAMIAALIPGIGTSLVLLPGILYLFIVGAGTQAIGLLIWGVVAVGLIDNMLGPKLLGKGIQLHPLLVLLSVLGGLAFFGAVGVFLGPLTVSLLFTLLSLYRRSA